MARPVVALLCQISRKMRDLEVEIKEHHGTESAAYYQFLTAAHHVELLNELTGARKPILKQLS